MKADKEFVLALRNASRLYDVGYVGSGYLGVLNSPMSAMYRFDMSEYDVDNVDRFVDLRKMVAVVSDGSEVLFEYNSLVVKNGSMTVNIAYKFVPGNKKSESMPGSENRRKIDGKEFVKDCEAIEKFSLDYTEFKKFLGSLATFDLDVVRFVFEDGNVKAVGFAADLEQYDNISIDVGNSEGKSNFHVSFSASLLDFIPTKYDAKIVELKNGTRALVLDGNGGKHFYIVAETVSN